MVKYRNGIVAFLVAVIVAAMRPQEWIFQIVCLIGLIIGSLAYTNPDLMWAMAVRGDRMLGFEHEDNQPLDWRVRSTRLGIALMLLSFITILWSVGTA